MNVCDSHGLGIHFVGDDFGQVPARLRLLTGIGRPGRAMHCVLCYPDHPDNPVRGLSGLNLFPTSDREIGERKIGEFFRRCRQ